MSENNFTKLLRILARPFQHVEDMWQQLMWERSIDTAIGAQLTQLGELVGQPRNGVTDDETYRRYVRARIVVNRSRGTIKDLIKVCQLVVYDDDATYTVVTHTVATVVVRVTGIALSTDLAALLLTFLRSSSGAAAGGVRVILEYSAEDPATWFQWDTVGRGWDNGKLIDATSE